VNILYSRDSTASDFAKYNINLNTKLKQNKRKKAWASKIRIETR
jgi:hypothetical protein